MNNTLKEKEETAQSESPQKPRKEMTKGDLLKQTRLERGLSLDAVHEATKIPMDALKAIEEGYTIRTLSEFYYKGFLKIYATYLAIDVSEVIDDYKHEEIQKVVPRPEKKESIDWKAWLAKNLTKERKQQLAILAGIILFLLILFKSITFVIHLVGQFNARARENKKPVVVEKIAEKKPVIKEAAPKEELKVVMKPVQAKPEKPVEKPKAAEKKVEPPAAEVKPREVVQPSKPKVLVPVPVPAAEQKVLPVTNQAVTPAVAPPAVKVAKDVTFTVRAKKSSWLRVLADGQTVFQATLRRGAVETWLADTSIELSGRNIDQLEFELNGKMIGSLGRSDRNAKKIIVTKDGLSVSK